MVVNERCDMIVVTAVRPHNRIEKFEPAVIEFFGKLNRIALDGSHSRALTGLFRVYVLAATPDISPVWVDSRVCDLASDRDLSIDRRLRDGTRALVAEARSGSMLQWRRVMIDHLGLIIKDPNKIIPFYEACLAPLGIKKVQDQPEWRAALFMIPGTRGSLWIGAGATDQPQRLTTYFHLSFIAPDEAAVRAFHKAGLAAGGTDNGTPGFRRPNCFAAFVLDPEGNNIEADWRTV